MYDDIYTRLINVDDTLTLRKMLLRPDLNLAKAKAPYSGPENSFHVGVFVSNNLVSNNLVSIASFIEKPHPRWQEGRQWMLRGMATHEKFQNQGLGRKAILFGFRELQKYKPRFVWCSARIRALPFYQRVGFKAVGPIVNHVKTGPRQLLWCRFVPVYVKE